MLRDWFDDLLAFLADHLALVKVVVAFAALGSLIAWGLYHELVDPPVEVGPSPSPANRVVILLHGHGASKTDLEPLAEELSEVVSDVSFILPSAPHSVGTGLTWYPSFRTKTQAEVEPTLQRYRAQARKVVVDIILELRSDGIPTSQVYVGGFSQGATLALDVFMNEPEAADLRGVISLSGGALPLDYSSLIDRAPPRTFVSHGTQDRVVGSSASRTIVSTLEDGGHDVTFVEFRGAHRIDVPVRRALGDFLLETKPSR